MESKGRPKRVVQVVLGHLIASPVKLRISLPDSGDRNWTGNKIWASGLILADWLTRQPCPGPLFGKHVLELGCGSAPLASAVALLRGGAATVLATDGDLTAVRAAEANLRQCTDFPFGSTAAVNAPLVSSNIIEEHSGRLQVRQLDWTEAIGNDNLRASYDAVIFADAVYTEDAASLVAACVDHCLKDTSQACVYGVVPDERIGASNLCRNMQRRGFTAKEIDLDPSAVADDFGVASIEGCSTPEEAVERGSCRLILWRRSWHGCEDESPRLEQHFDQAVAAAERRVDERLCELGYLPSE